MTPRQRNTILCSSSQQIPRLRLKPLTRLCVASGTTEIHGHRQVYRVRRGRPRTPSRIIYTNLDCAFVENALFIYDP